MLVGACHGEDLFYLFRMKNNLIDMTYSYDDEKNMIDTFCSLWTNFAKYGFEFFFLYRINCITSIDCTCGLNVLLYPAS